MGGQLPLSSYAPCGRVCNVGAVYALAMPVRSDTKGDWPVRRLLKNGSVAVVHHLVAVVLECLAKVIQFGPSLVTGRTGHTVLACERGDGTEVKRGRR